MKVKELLFVITLKDIRMKSLKKTNERLIIVTENILRRMLVSMTLLIIVALGKKVRKEVREVSVEVFQLLIILIIILLKILLLSPMIISKPLSTIDANQVAWIYSIIITILPITPVAVLLLHNHYHTGYPHRITLPT